MRLKLKLLFASANWRALMIVGYGEDAEDEEDADGKQTISGEWLNIVG